MATITYRCDLCSSEILGARRGSAPHICVLCRLSAEEVTGAEEAVRHSAPPVFRMPTRNHPVSTAHRQAARAR
jgi:hypothetical protein